MSTGTQKCLVSLLRRSFDFIARPPAHYRSDHFVHFRCAVRCRLRLFTACRTPHGVVHRLTAGSDSCNIAGHGEQLWTGLAVAQSPTSSNCLSLHRCILLGRAIWFRFVQVCKSKSPEGCVGRSGAFRSLDACSWTRLAECTCFTRLDHGFAQRSSTDRNINQWAANSFYVAGQAT